MKYMQDIIEIVKVEKEEESKSHTRPLSKTLIHALTVIVVELIPKRPKHSKNITMSSNPSGIY